MLTRRNARPRLGWRIRERLVDSFLESRRQKDTKEKTVKNAPVRPTHRSPSLANRRKASLDGKKLFGVLGRTKVELQSKLLFFVISGRRSVGERNAAGLTVDFDGAVGFAAGVFGHAAVRAKVFDRQVADAQLEVRLVGRGRQRAERLLTRFVPCF